MSSFDSYDEGSATAEQRRSVDEAARIAEEQKRKAPPDHHLEIDCLLDAYARRLAANINRRNAIAARLPSVLFGHKGLHFPAQKVERQRRDAAANQAERQRIESILDKIRGSAVEIEKDSGGRTRAPRISAGDPDLVQKLTSRAKRLEARQKMMLEVNAYYREHKTLEGCPGLDPVQIEKLKASMARDWRKDPKPYPSFHLTNNNAVIRQTKKRIEELSARAEMGYEGWTFDGGEVKMDRQANRLQVFFDEKPDRDTCSTMRHNGFKWAPSVGAWQRQLTDNAIYAAKHLDCLRPLSEVQPVPEQAEPVQEAAQDAAAGWGFYVIADLKTWADNTVERSELEHFPSFEAAKARFDELRSEPYNSEAVDPSPDGQPPARLTLGLESADGMSAADILHVRQGENYLVTDFIRSERLREDPVVMDVLSRISREIGFDRVRVWEQVNGGRQLLSIVPFAEWENPYFPASTPGRIAAQYCALLHECYPLPSEDAAHDGQIAEIVRYIQKQGKRGVGQMAQAVAGFGITFSDNATVQKLVSSLMAELAQYNESGMDEARQQKSKRRQPQER